MMQWQPNVEFPYHKGRYYSVVPNRTTVAVNTVLSSWEATDADLSEIPGGNQQNDDQSIRTVDKHFFVVFIVMQCVYCHVVDIDD